MAWYIDHSIELEWYNDSYLTIHDFYVQNENLSQKDPQKRQPLKT